MNPKKYAFACSFLLLVTAAVYPVRAQQALKPDSISLHLADPAIFLYKGIYYLYGTVEGNSGNGFLVYTSRNLKNWKPDPTTRDGYALKKPEAFGRSGFWAPQVFHYGEEFYMAYVANENIALAESESPAGPFTQLVKKPLEAPMKQIDPFIFTDDDGKTYLYHVRLANGNRIFVAEMNDSLTAIKPETLKECIAASDSWENTRNATWPVAEGPTVIRHKNLYYLIYSANDFRNPDYAVGYAVSSHPLGPWKKYEGNPILSRHTIGINGSGHGDVFFDKRGRMLYVFHTHYSNEKVAPRRTAVMQFRFVKDPSGPDIIAADQQSFRYLKP